VLQEDSRYYPNKNIMPAQFSDEDLIGPPLYELYLGVILEKMHSRARDVEGFVNDAITVPARQGTLTDQELEEVVASVAGDALSLYGMFYLFRKDTNQSKVDMSDPRLMFLGPENWLDNDDDPWKLELTIGAIADALNNIELSGQTCPGLQYRVIQDALDTIKFVRHSISSTLRENVKGTAPKQSKNAQTARELNTRKTPQDARTRSVSSSLQHPEQISTLSEESKTARAAQDVLIQQLQDKVARQAELLQGHAALQAELSEARTANTKLRMDALDSGASISAAPIPLLSGEVGIVKNAGSYVEQEVHARNAEISRLHVAATMSSATFRADKDALTTELQELRQKLAKMELAKNRWRDTVTHLVESGLVGKE
jgi:hypothetical protein